MVLLGGVLPRRAAAVTFQAALLKDRFDVLDHLRVAAQHLVAGFRLDLFADAILQCSALEQVGYASGQTVPIVLAA